MDCNPGSADLKTRKADDQSSLLMLMQQNFIRRLHSFSFSNSIILKEVIRGVSDVGFPIFTDTYAYADFAF